VRLTCDLSRAYVQCDNGRNRNDVKTKCSEPAQFLSTEVCHKVPVSDTQIRSAQEMFLNSRADGRKIEANAIKAASLPNEESTLQVTGDF